MRLDVEGLGVWLPHGGTAFEGLTLSVDAGQAVLLAGRNGSGASSVLTCIAGRSRPGERRVGRVRYGNADLSRAHADEIAGFASLVGPGDLPEDVTVGDVLASGRRRGEGDGGISGGLADRLGLDGLGAVRGRDLTGSQRIRCQLAAGLARRPRLLLLDQVLGPLESRWKGPVCALVRQHCAAGGSVLWAEQDLAHALTAVDRVVELGPGGASGAEAWRWRPRTLPWTPLQQLASALGDARPGDNTVEGLRRFSPALSAAAEDAAARTSSRGSQVPVPLGGGQQLVVDDTEPPVFLCGSARQARACRAQLAGANRVPELPIHPRVTVRRIARRADRLRGMPAGTTLAALARALPAVRPDSWLSWHSSGEQARLRNALALAGPSVRLVHEPFRYLDRAGVGDLVDQVEAAWLSGAPVLVVTTDVEAASRFRRTIVWTEEGIRADGRAEAVLGRLPALPLVAQVCAPHPIVSLDGLLHGLAGRPA